MTNSEKQAHRQAARLSKTEGPRYVVWVFDQGREVYDGEQARLWKAFLTVEAVYIDGVQVTTEQVSA